MDDCVNLADVGQKLVAQAFAVACTFYKTCNVNKFDDSRCVFFRVLHFCKFVQSFVRHSNHANVWLDCAERKVCTGSTSVCNSVEKCAFANVWQANDTKFHILKSIPKIPVFIRIFAFL